MDFTNRSILVALVALAIPLVIHLLGHRQAKRMALPTVRFAEGAHHARRGRLWLKRLALLAMRLAVVALLVLALAGPRLGGASLGTPERWLICLDTSPSMAAAGRAAAPGRATVFDAARTAVLQLLAALPDAAPATLALSDGRTFAETAREARDTLTGLPGASWHEEPLGRTIRRALGTLPRKTPPGAPGVHLVIATDATPWALRDLRPGAFKELVSDVTLLALTPAEGVGWLGLPATRVVSGPQGCTLEVDVETASVGAGTLRARAAGGYTCARRSRAMARGRGEFTCSTTIPPSPAPIGSSPQPPGGRSACSWSMRRTRRRRGSVRPTSLPPRSAAIPPCSSG
jgi:hypothetical protein